MNNEPDTPKGNELLDAIRKVVRGPRGAIGDVPSDLDGDDECLSIIVDRDDSVSPEFQEQLKTINEPHTSSMEVLPAPDELGHSSGAAMGDREQGVCCIYCGRSEEPVVSRYDSRSKDLEDAWQDIVEKMSPILVDKHHLVRNVRKFPRSDIQESIIRALERLLRLESELSSGEGKEKASDVDVDHSSAYEDLSAFVVTLLASVGMTEDLEVLGEHRDKKGLDEVVLRMREISHRSSVLEVEHLSGIISSLVSLMMETTNALHANCNGEGLGLLLMAGQGEEYRKALLDYLDHDPRLEGAILPNRLETTVMKAGVSAALRDVAKMTAVEFLGVHGVGKGYLRGVVQQLEEIGVHSVLGASAKYMDDAKQTIESLQEDGFLDRDGRLCGEAGQVADRLLTNALHGFPYEWVIRSGKNKLVVPVLRSMAIENAQCNLEEILRNANVVRS